MAFNKVTYYLKNNNDISFLLYKMDGLIIAIDIYLRHCIKHKIYFSCCHLPILIYLCGFFSENSFSLNSGIRSFSD